MIKTNTGVVPVLVYSFFCGLSDMSHHSLPPDIDKRTVDTIFVKRGNLKYVITIEIIKIISILECIVDGYVSVFGIEDFFVAYFVTAQIGNIQIIAIFTLVRCRPANAHRPCYLFAVGRRGT